MHNRDLVLAHRLCLKFGVQDAEQWLEDCPRRVWKNWKSYFSLEPWGNENQLLASIAASLQVIAAKGTDEDGAAATQKVIEKLTALGVDPLWIGRSKIDWDSSEQDSIKAFQARMEGG